MGEIKLREAGQANFSAVGFFVFPYLPFFTSSCFLASFFQFFLLILSSAFPLSSAERYFAVQS
jgi:hypothetical protein